MWRIATAGALGLSIATAFSRRRPPPTAAILVLSLCAGYAGAVHDTARMLVPAQHLGASCSLKGVVQSAGVSRGKALTVYVLEGATASGFRLDKKCFALDLGDKGNKIWSPGEIVAVEGHVASVDPLNPGEFDLAAYYRSKGLAGLIRVSEISSLRPASPSLPLIVHSWRCRLAQVVEAALPSEEAALLKGMLLGDTVDISDQILVDFRRAGVFHVLCVSGLHVHYLLAPATLVLKRVVHPGVRLAVQAAALTLYCGLTGGQPSVVRAALMAVLPQVAIVIGRRCDAMNALIVACLCILVVKPLALFDPGLRLSCAATLGLILLSGKVRRLLIWMPDWAAGALSVTLAAQVLTLPIMTGSGGISLHSFVANPLVVPVVGIGLAWGMGGSLAALLLPQGALQSTMLMPAGVLMRVSMGITAFLARLPGGKYALPPLTPVEKGVYYLVCQLVFGLWHPKFYSSPRARPGGNVAIILLLVLLARCTLPARPRGALRITFVAVGQGDSALIETPGGRTVMVDCGTEESVDRHVLPLLFVRRIRTIDLLVVTHRHADHMGGLLKLQSEVNIRHILAGIPGTPLDGQAGCIGLPEGLAGHDVAEASSTLELPPGVSQVILEDWSMAIGGGGLARDDSYTVKIAALWPREYVCGSENDRSVVLLVSYGMFRALLMADAGTAVESQIIERNNGNDLRCDVLKVGHHGSKHSTSAAFLQEVDPALAVISVGSNSFGHPSREVIKMLESRGIVTVRTDRHGAVTIITDGRRLKASWFKK